MLITISNLYGCGAVAVAHAAAERLGYEYVDEQLPVVVAKRLRTSPEAVESAGEAAGTMSERMLRALETGTPEVRSEQGATFEEECLREVQDAVRECAARGNAVIVGRGAHAILGRRPDVLRTFMYAPREWRIRHIMDGHRVDERTAAAEVDRVDRGRRDYMLAYYNVEWTDLENFDLCLDTASLGTQRCAAIIAAAVAPQ